MRVAAINPPFMDGRFSRTSRSPAIVKSGTMYWPFWLAYAVGSLEKEGHQVLFLDCPATSVGLEEMLDMVGSFAPELTILDTSTPSINSDINAARELKQILPDCPLIMVGTHASARPE